MENNNNLPPAPRYQTEQQRADAMEAHRSARVIPLPVDRDMVDRDTLNWADLEQEEADASNVVASGTEPEASANQSADPVSNDTHLQLALQNAHPFQNASLPLTERVDAFNLLEQEGIDRRAQAKGQECQECGKRHPPPHLSKEQSSALGLAYREGRRLRQQLQQTASGPSQNSTTGAAPSGPSGPSGSSAPSSRKGKSAFCNRCAKWHPGGSQACRTPLCAGCGLHHPHQENCGDASRRFTNVIQARQANEARGRGMALPTPFPPASYPPAPFSPAPFSPFAAGGGGFGGLASLAGGPSADTGETMRNIGSLLSTVSQLFTNFSGEKRPAPGPALPPGHQQWQQWQWQQQQEQQQPQQKKKKKNKKTGQGPSCQGPQSHHKGPPKPDDGGKGKGRAMQPAAQPGSAWT